MRSQILPLVLASTSLAVAQNATSPGYTGYPEPIVSTIAANESLSFGQHYAVLNLDLINGLVAPLASSPAGSAFIKNTATWIDAVHALSPPPLSIFTRIYFSNARKPEVKPGSGFASVSAPLTTANATATQIYSDFSVDETAGDVVLQKTRYYAGTGNALEEILRAQGIDTVILSGVRTSGVILSTAYRLFDLDYKVYVFSKSHHESLSATMCLLTIDLGTSSPTTPLKLHPIRLASMLRFWRV
jgi:nicotinamidase-related amidase